MVSNAVKHKVRKIVGYVLEGGPCMAQHVHVLVYNNSLSNVWRGLMERLYYVKDGAGGFEACPKPEPGIFSTLTSFTKGVCRYLPRHATPMTVEQFIGCYSGSKKKRYQRAADTLRTRPLRRNDANLGTFIKGEFYNATNKSDPCTRLIQPRSVFYLLETGRYLKPIEKLIYRAIDLLFGYHAVLKCDNPLKRAETVRGYWNEFMDPVYVGYDAKRFDQHVSTEALEFEHSIYKAPYKSDSYFSTIINWQLNNRGYARTPDGLVVYEQQGCRMSGDMNTALGNVILMCAVTKHFMDDLGIKYRFIDDGDDCGVFVEREHLALLDELPAHHLRYGFEMEVEPPAYRMEEIEFCQSRPIHIGEDKWVMVRNIHKAMLQDMLHIDKDWARLDELRHSIGLCGLSLNEGLPIMDAFYRSMLTEDVRSNVVERLMLERHGDFYHCVGSHTLSTSFVVNTDAARVSIYYAFGILPDLQVHLEDTFRAAKIQSHPVQTLNHNAKSTDRIAYTLD